MSEKNEKTSKKTDLKKHIMQLLQKVIIEHLRSFLGKGRISNLVGD